MFASMIVGACSGLLWRGASVEQCSEAKKDAGHLANGQTVKNVEILHH